MLSDLASRMADYEAGGLSDQEVTDLFQDLLDQGVLDHLQGHYRRMAKTLFRAGLISPAPVEESHEG